MHSWVAQCGGGPYYSPQWYRAAPPRSDALRPWAWPRATGGRRGGGGGGGRWRAAGPEPGRAMAASERLYELWLLYNAQVRPPRPRPPCSPRPAPRACCTCAPRHPCPRRCARAKRARAPHTRVRPQPRRCLWHFYLGDNPRGPAPHKALLGGDRHPQWCQRGAWTKPARHFPLLQMGKLRPGNKMRDRRVGKDWET